MADPERIREIIEATLVDCYGEYEEMSAWGVTFDDAVRRPFEARALGKPVRVLRFDAEEGRGVRCEIEGAGIARRWVGIDALDLESVPPGLQEVIEAYEAYAEGDY